MTTINFYRQVRKDGGKRTGIEINGETVLGRFEKGKKPEDSALLWFVDVRCSGRNLPEDPEAARKWLLEKPAIQNALEKIADELRAGIDFSEPISRKVPNAGHGITIYIFCSAVVRLQALDMANALAETSSHWVEFITSLECLEPVSL
jgi:hypothetical protein